jgi:hypothetical protein
LGSAARNGFPARRPHSLGPDVKGLARLPVAIDPIDMVGVVGSWQATVMTASISPIGPVWSSGGGRSSTRVERVTACSASLFTKRLKQKATAVVGAAT